MKKYWLRKTKNLVITMYKQMVAVQQPERLETTHGVYEQVCGSRFFGDNQGEATFFLTEQGDVLVDMGLVAADGEPRYEVSPMEPTKANYERLEHAHLVWSTAVMAMAFERDGFEGLMEIAHAFEEEVF